MFSDVNALFLCIAFTLCIAPCTAAERFEFQSVEMGVPVRVVLYTETNERAKQAADAVFETFHRLNGIMSDYDSESELSLLGKESTDEASRQRSTAKLPVSTDLFAVLKEAKHYSTLSDGAFDVTVGSYTRLWRRSRRMKELPKPVYLERAKELVGNALWELDETSQSIILKKEGMKFDLGGIAKGYAIDRAFEAVQRLGIAAVLIDAGGDMRFGTAPPSGWSIQFGDEVMKNLENAAVASSGDTFQFVEIDGKRYSHIIDPQTGLGTTSPRIVYVTAPNATQADALASALSVMPPEKGIALVKTLKNIAAKIVVP